MLFPQKITNMFGTHCNTNFKKYFLSHIPPIEVWLDFTFPNYQVYEFIYSSLNWDTENCCCHLSECGLERSSEQFNIPIDRYR